MEVTTIGLYIAKRVFQVHGVDAAGRAVVRRKLGRSEVLDFFHALPPCPVGIEACGTAHHWAREIQALGHEVRLIPAAYVKPYVKRGKTDAADHSLLRLLVLGATTVIRRNRTKAGEGWLASLIARRPTMVAAVAQANKAARIVWALLARGGTYDPHRSAPRPAAA